MGESVTDLYAPTAVDYERSARQSLERRVEELAQRLLHLEARVEKHFPEAIERIKGGIRCPTVKALRGEDDDE
jgi:hypothetical protein